MYGCSSMALWSTVFENVHFSRAFLHTRSTWLWPSPCLSLVFSLSVDTDGQTLADVWWLIINSVRWHRWASQRLFNTHYKTNNTHTILHVPLYHPYKHMITFTSRITTISSQLIAQMVVYVYLKCFTPRHRRTVCLLESFLTVSLILIALCFSLYGLFASQRSSALYLEDPPTTTTHPPDWESSTDVNLIYQTPHNLVQSAWH